MVSEPRPGWLQVEGGFQCSHGCHGQGSDEATGPTMPEIHHKVGAPLLWLGPGPLLNCIRVSTIPEPSDTAKDLAEGVSWLPLFLRDGHVSQ